MASVISGKVTFANGMVARNISVRVFDKDAPGKTDDDLTLTPGLSDQNGQFTVEYDPGRYMDFATLPFIGLHRSGGGGGLRIPDPLDILSPYLLFTWTVEGTTQTHTAPLELFNDQFHLPAASPMDFLPSRDGFHFLNSFSGYMLPITVPFLSDSKVKGPYGLCGGMSAGAIDFMLSGRKMLADKEPPRRGTLMHRYLFRRAMDSFAMGESILRFARWMLLPDDGMNGTYRLTLKEWEKVRAVLDDNRLVPLGQLRAKAANMQQVSRDVWNNHQVMAYGYREKPDSSFDIRIYDPNCPNEDGVFIHLDRIQLGEENGLPVYGMACYECDCWEKHRVLHGFFAMPYEPADPPQIR
jgi:hypothetical protein